MTKIQKVSKKTTAFAGNFYSYELFTKLIYWMWIFYKLSAGPLNVGQGELSPDRNKTEFWVKFKVHLDMKALCLNKNPSKKSECQDGNADKIILK